MSWMTPVGDARVASDGLDTAGTSFPEDVLDPVVPLLHPDQAEAQVGGDVAHHVDVVSSTTSTSTSRPAGVARSPASTSACPSSRSASGGPCTSTSSAPVACVKSVVAEDCSSRPVSSTTTWSLIRSSSPSRWEVTSTAMPNSVPILRTSASMSSRAAGSRPLVGSSSSTRRGSWTRAWASLTRCFMPVE